MKLFFFTGAGVSAESGIPTYRDSTNGLWYNYKVEEVATAQAWKKNPKKVLEFFNMMRKKLDDYIPNSAHVAISDLEKEYDVVVVTQNVDDLHERAGSTNVIHLHGNLRFKRTSSLNLVPIYYPYTEDIKIGDRDPAYKSQFRPDVVLYGESVPQMVSAIKHVDDSDVLIIIGTTLDVYPAAQLVDYFLHDGKPVFYVDPNPNVEHVADKVTYITKKATEGMIDLTTALTSIQK